MIDDKIEENDKVIKEADKEEDDQDVKPQESVVDD